MQGLKFWRLERVDRAIRGCGSDTQAGVALSGSMPVGSFDSGEESQPGDQKQPRGDSQVDRHMNVEQYQLSRNDGKRTQVIGEPRRDGLIDARVPPRHMRDEQVADPDHAEQIVGLIQEINANAAAT